MSLGAPLPPAQTPADPRPRHPSVGYLPVLALVLVLAPFYATSIGDIDIWWHLAAGRWIAEHGALPDVDPFGVFGAGNPIRMATVLKGQWLGQLAFFEAFDALGSHGLVALRVALLSACVAAVWLRARRLGSAALARTMVAMLVGLGLLGYTGDRPQLFSFALAAVLAFLVEELEKGRRWALATIPCIGLVWVNLHGGVLIGVAVLGVWTVAEGLRVLRGGDRSRLARMSLATVLFAATTLLSPNGIVTYAYVLQTQGGELASRTTEYVSALRVASVGGWERQALVLVYFAAAAAALPRIWTGSPGRAAVVVLLGVASAASYRYHAFFLVMAGPWIAAGLSPWFARLGGRPWAGPLASGATWAAGAAVLAWLHVPLQAFREPVAAATLPTAAVEVIRTSGAGGRILSWFGWGGYVLWELSPGVRPFVDPRMLDDASLGPYTHMIWATPEGMAEFERDRFEFVLLPFVSPTGEVYPLHAILRGHPEWAVEYVWRDGALYRRRRT